MSALLWRASTSIVAKGFLVVCQLRFIRSVSTHPSFQFSQVLFLSPSAHMGKQTVPARWQVSSTPKLQTRSIAQPGDIFHTFNYCSSGKQWTDCQNVRGFLHAVFCPHEFDVHRTRFTSCDATWGTLERARISKKILPCICQMIQVGSVVKKFNTTTTKPSPLTPAFSSTVVNLMLEGFLKEDCKND